MKKFILGNILLFSLFVFLPTMSMAGNACDGISLDNDTSDWADVEALVSDPGTTVGTTYYWANDLWQDEPPDNYEYSTNVAQMADLENIKMCNDMKALFLYVDAQHPIFGVFNVEDQKYEEFGDPEESSMGMPEAFNYWMVYKMQKQGSSNIYFYGIHLVANEGDPGMQSGPTKQALYKDDGDGIFNPNTDTELAEFEASDEDLFEGSNDTKGKTYDQDGGIEVGLFLVNKDGEGLFTSTDISYGDTIDTTVAMYPNSSFTLAERSIQSVEETDEFEYRVAKVGVQNVRVPKKKKKKFKATVRWDEVSVASKYIGKLYKKKKLLRTFKTTSTKKVLKKLKANTKYKVKIRAKISTVKTPYSDKKKFRTKK
ncbi:MAG: hypothetical protein ABID45_04625 [Patescibacteria group bacterium]